MPKPEVWTFAQLRAATLESAVVWTVPPLATMVAGVLPYPQVNDLNELNATVKTLIAIGGGVLLDQAKYFRRSQRPNLRLIAVPSLWGSGAENSPIVALNRDAEKRIDIDPAYLPDVRVIWPELAEQAPLPLLQWGCGDVWAHAMEAFLSPLATPELRGELTELIRRLLAVGIGPASTWFELSAQACAMQAQASVGLVHGIAHVLEGALHAANLPTPFGHARLCSLYLYPVMRYNQSASEKFARLLNEHNLNAEDILGELRSLYDDDDYDLLLPHLVEHWRAIVRNPLSRANSALVRPNALEYFQGKSFYHE